METTSEGLQLPLYQIPICFSTFKVLRALSPLSVHYIQQYSCILSNRKAQPGTAHTSQSHVWLSTGALWLKFQRKWDMEHLEEVRYLETDHGMEARPVVAPATVEV